MDSFFQNFGIDWKLLIIQIINFGFLLYILKRFLYKPILGVLDHRQNQVKKNLDSAEEMKKELATFHLQREDDSRLAHLEVEKALKVASEHAAAIEAKAIEDAKTSSAHILDQARQLIYTEKARIIQDAKKEIIETVILATEKLLSREINGKGGAEEYIKQSLGK